MILEGLLTTLNEDGTARIAAMGPLVDSCHLTRLVLRPFPDSRTGTNLKRHGQGVFHITDDVELLARAAVDRLETMPASVRIEGVQGLVLADACRWYALRVANVDRRGDRDWIDCDVVQRGWQRDFLGFNRAKHAVLEAAILATRIHLLPARQLHEDLLRLATIVEKTGGEQEHRAIEFLFQYVQQVSSAGVPAEEAGS